MMYPFHMTINILPYLHLLINPHLLRVAVDLDDERVHRRALQLGDTVGITEFRITVGITLGTGR